MTMPMIIALAVTAFMIYLIMTDKVPFGAAPLIACALMVLFGVTDIATAFRGFSNSSIIMLASFMVIIAALQKTSFIQAFKHTMVKMAAKGGYKAYVLIILVAMLGTSLFGTGSTAYYVMTLGLLSTIPSTKELPRSKFLMPAGDVTFKATYLRVTKYGIVIVDGTKDKEVAKAGETVAITANPAPTGKVFDKWTCETAGVTIVFESATSSTTTFVMPACEITIQAHFRDIEAAPSIEIKVNGGTGAGTYKEGDSVTITANDPAEGKVFKGWQDESGKIVSTEKSYTFTVNGETTLTAVYEDESSGGGEITPPAKKDGLSGGQVAGIVIGTLLLAGIGGFAVLWFAIKKKTFADLGVVLKKGFTAIGNFFKNLGAKIKALFTKKK